MQDPTFSFLLFFGPLDMLIGIQIHITNVQQVRNRFTGLGRKIYLGRAATDPMCNRRTDNKMGNERADPNPPVLRCIKKTDGVSNPVWI